MDNCKKDAKNVSFGILGYNIEIYAKQSPELSLKMTHNKRKRNEGDEGITSDERECRSGNDPTAE